MKKIILGMSLVILILSSCSKTNSESSNLLLSEQEIKLDENKIVFGDKVEGKVKLNNKFQVNENVYFVILLKEEIGEESITIKLNKSVNDSWQKITQKNLPVKSSSKEIMNGLPNSIFKQVGSGAYQLVAVKEDSELAKGEFIIVNNNKSNGSK